MKRGTKKSIEEEESVLKRDSEFCTPEREEESGSFGGGWCFSGESNSWWHGLIIWCTFVFYTSSFIQFQARGKENGSSFMCFIISTAFSALLFSPIGEIIQLISYTLGCKKKGERRWWKSTQQRTSCLMIFGFFSFFLARSIFSLINQSASCHDDWKEGHLLFLHICYAKKFFKHQRVWILHLSLSYYVVSYPTKIKRRWVTKLAQWKQRIRKNERKSLIFVIVPFCLIFFGSMLLSEKDLMHSWFSARFFPIIRADVLIFLIIDLVGVCILINKSYFLKIDRLKLSQNFSIINLGINLFIRANQGVIAYLMVINIQRVCLVFICFAVIDECDEFMKILFEDISDRVEVKGDEEENEENTKIYSHVHKSSQQLKNRFINDCMEHFFLERNEKHIVKKVFGEGTTLDDLSPSGKWGSVRSFLRYKHFEDLGKRIDGVHRRTWWLVSCVFVERVVAVLFLVSSIYLFDFTIEGDENNELDWSKISNFWWKVVLRHGFYIIVVYYYLFIRIRNCNLEYVKLIRCGRDVIRRVIAEEKHLELFQMQKERFDYLNEVVLEKKLMRKGLTICGFDPSTSYVNYILQYGTYCIPALVGIWKLIKEYLYKLYTE